MIFSSRNILYLFPSVSPPSLLRISELGAVSFSELFLACHTLRLLPPIEIFLSGFLAKFSIQSAPGLSFEIVKTLLWELVVILTHLYWVIKSKFEIHSIHHIKIPKFQVKLQLQSPNFPRIFEMFRYIFMNFEAN